MNLNLLRAINNAQIKTLQDTLQPKGEDSLELFQAQVVQKILADDLCFQKMSQAEAVQVLRHLGFTDAAAQEEAEKIYRALSMR